MLKELKENETDHAIEISNGKLLLSSSDVIVISFFKVNYKLTTIRPPWER